MAAMIEVRKNVNQVGQGFDTIFYYSLTICNTGDVNFTDIVLVDVLDSLITLVPDSVTRDGNVIANPNLTMGVSLGPLAIGEWSIVCYAAQVTVGTCGGCVSNTATVTGTYTVAGTTGTVVANSNTTYGRVDMECFRQELLSRTLTLPITSTDMESVEEVYARTLVNTSYTIPTYKGTSHECQVLSGCKLVVAGEIDLEVMYTALTTVQQVQCAKFKIPIFNYVVVPNTTGTQSYDVRIIVEKVAYERINARDICVNLLYCIQVSM